jgi:hypothetical protein
MTHPFDGGSTRVWYVLPFVPFISGWFCVYIPMGLFQSGNNCVGESSVVGQKILYVNTGKVGVVKELHGRSERCQSAAYPILATVDFD